VGDQIGVAVSGTLYYVPFTEYERVRQLPVTEVERAAIFATLSRVNTLYMIARAGSGHIGSSFSSLDMMSWLLCQEVRTPREGDLDSPRDIFFSSKGHDAPALYSTLIGLGRLEFDLIHKLRRQGGLPGHPDISTPNMVTNTSSLGMGVSKAKGMIFANRLLKRSGHVYVLTGDGELQEGQFWESLISAANHRLHELIVIIDHNKLQSDTLVKKVSDLEELEGKLTAFGWHVCRCDGNDIGAFASALEASKRVADRPKAIIADTIKGKGVSFMEHTSIDSDVELYKFHSGAPTDDAYIKAAQELIDTANAKLTAANAEPLELESVIRSAPAVPENPQRLVRAYSHALVEQARAHPTIVALDADLVVDTGLVPFQREFPSRFIECGIAEQDMVSMAGGLALQGMLPVVHSFACFLSARPNEQIYNNATEKRKIVYVGSLAGVVPGGPGHSHQAVRDISALAAVPGLVMMEPANEVEVGMLLDWAINVHPYSSYLRLVSVPWPVPYGLPDDYRPELGRGVSLTGGDDGVIIGYGPVMLSAAVHAAEILRREGGLKVKVINLPWLNVVDGHWLMREVAKAAVVVSLDNHYLVGGQGDRIASVLADEAQTGRRFCRVALQSTPTGGTDAQVLGAHQMDAEAIVMNVRVMLAGKGSQRAESTGG
jgi:transketolase